MTSICSAVNLGVASSSKLLVAMNVHFEGADGEVIDRNRRLTADLPHHLQAALTETLLWAVRESFDVLGKS